MSRFVFFFFFQAEDGIRDLVRSRGLGDVYKRQLHDEADGRAGGDGVQPVGVAQLIGLADGQVIADLSLIHI